LKIVLFTMTTILSPVIQLGNDHLTFREAIYFCLISVKFIKKKL
jgi:hypothetical protein